VAGRRAGAGLAVAVVALTGAGCGFRTATKTVTTTLTHTVTATRTITTTSAPAQQPCGGFQLSGTFSEVSGSGAAGQVEYRLTLKNTSPTPCYLFGLPQAQLLSANGSALPTHVTASQSGSSGARVLLAPGHSAITQAHFSPSVSGQGDSQSGPCQPTASVLRVTPDGGGTVDAPIKPPTSVCERGTLYFDDFTPAS
jgi:hypothetical protein